MTISQQAEANNLSNYERVWNESQYQQSVNTSSYVNVPRKEKGNRNENTLFRLIIPNRISPSIHSILLRKQWLFLEREISGMA